MRDEPLSRRLKRWGWACADVAFHITFTLFIVLLSFFEIIYNEIVTTLHDWRNP